MKFRELIEECEKWHQANRLRNYIDAVNKERSLNRFKSISEKESWLEWAYIKVEEIDPQLNNRRELEPD